MYFSFFSLFVYLINAAIEPVTKHCSSRLHGSVHDVKNKIREGGAGAMQY
jgi:hypothetical protein